MATSNFPLSSLPLEWSKTESWMEQFNFFIESAGIANDRKKATFLANCGNDAYNLIRSLILPTQLTDDGVVFDNPNEDQISITQILSDHLRPRQILHYERYKFFNCFQNQGSIQEFVAELRRRSASCDFGQLKAALLLTQFIIGINNSKLKEKFLSEPNLSFETAIQESFLWVESSNAATSIANPGERHGSISFLSDSNSSTTFNNVDNSKDSVSFLQNAKKSVRSTGKVVNNCRSCGEFHSRFTCRFRKSKCFKCSKIGHIAKVCRSIFSGYDSSDNASASDQNRISKQVNELEIFSINGKNTFLRDFYINGHRHTDLFD